MPCSTTGTGKACISFCSLVFGWVFFWPASHVLPKGTPGNIAHSGQRKLQHLSFELSLILAIKNESSFVCRRLCQEALALPMEPSATSVLQHLCKKYFSYYENDMLCQATFHRVLYLLCRVVVHGKYVVINEPLWKYFFSHCTLLWNSGSELLGTGESLLFVYLALCNLDTRDRGGRFLLFLHTGDQISA